jgi:molybdenum transport protein
MMKCVVTDEQLSKLLFDDAPYGDLTTNLFITPNETATIEFRARQFMTLSGVEEAARMFELQGTQAEIFEPSGKTIEAETLFLRARGSASNLFVVWKMAQVLVEWMSGVASATKALVDVADGIPVACTRKQTPGTKALSVKAVRNGGGTIHRLGLSETVLIFAEHRQFIDLDAQDTLAVVRQKAPESRAVVEVHHLDDAKYWAQAGADVLQMDKFTPELVAAVAQYCQENQLSTLLAVAGGVSIHNAARYVAAGARLLVTSSPYQAGPKDVQVNFYS